DDGPRRARRVLDQEEDQRAEGEGEREAEPGEPGEGGLPGRDPGACGGQREAEQAEGGGAEGEAAAAGEAALADVGRRHGRGDRSLRCRTGAEGVNIRAGDRRGARETGGPPPSRSGGRPILTPSPAD